MGQATYPPSSTRVLYLFWDATLVPPRMAASATRSGHSHRRPPPPPSGRSPGGGTGSCPMAPTPGDHPTSSPNAQAPSHILRHGNTPSRFLPPAPTMCSPAPLRCDGCSASFPTLQALCAHLDSPGTTCTFAPDNCPVVDADRHLLALCTFCGRYFRSDGLSRHQHYCFHRNSTPSQPPACGASLPRGRPSPLHPHSLAPCPPPSNGALTMGLLVGRTPKPSSSPISFPSDLVRPGTAPPLRWYASSSRSSRSLSVAFHLSTVGPPKGLPWKRLGRRCFYFRA
jgi:hypothetical protein